MEEAKKKKGKTFTRRDFLKGFSGGALGAAVVPRLVSQDLLLLKTKAGDVPLFSEKKIRLTMNGTPLSITVGVQETLLEVLRNRLNLTGTKKVCNQGECGGCTALVDGSPVYSCHFLAIRADGKKVQTIEGLAEGDKLHPVQEAFIEKDGYQCGFCTPGFILSSAALLNNNLNPGLEDVKEALSGNLCRCGNHTKIYEAVLSAAQEMRRS